MKRQLLTIAIPTWNRNGQAEQTVTALVPQLRPGVSIVLVDNCSDKPIEETISAALKRHIRIVRHPMNIGGCANILRCFELADSDWVWIMGDDDDPAPDAIDRAMQAIANNPDCCLLDFGHPFKTTRQNSIKTRSAKEAINAMYYPSGKAEIYAWSDGHISNEIYNKKLMDHRIQYGYKYIYTYYPQVAMLFSALSDGSPCLFTGPQLAMIRNHGEAPVTYTRNDMTKGWKQLAELLQDTESQELFLAALNSSVEYGEPPVEKPAPPEGIIKKIYRSILPKSIRRVVANLRHG